MLKIPNYVRLVDETLKNAGYESFLVGGSLRDILLNRNPKDFDLATNALPDQIAKLFGKTVLTAANFGTVIVLVYDEHEELHEVEVTTYRKEKNYVSGRWPSRVEFTSSLHEDLARRDFTINAMALDLTVYFNFFDLHKEDALLTDYLKEYLFDYFGGITDLESCTIKAVGNPVERFSEDGLRPIRACRLASVLNFGIDQITFEAITETLNIVKLVSKERVRDELEKIILDSDDPSQGIELLRKSGILEIFIPELLEGFGMYQNKYHSDDVYYHLLSAVDIADKDIRLAALFHDIAKPRCKVGGTFYGHDIIGSTMANKILRRLKFPKKICEEVRHLVRWHMFNFETNKGRKCIDGKPSSKPSEFVSDSAIRRLIKNIGGHENMEKLIRLRVADATSNKKRSFDSSETDALGIRVAKFRENESVASIRDLSINGYDLLENGIPSGPIMKKVLNHLLEIIIEEPIKNSKDILIQEAILFYSNELSKM